MLLLTDGNDRGVGLELTSFYCTHRQVLATNGYFRCLGCGGSFLQEALEDEWARGVIDAVRTP